MARVGSFIGPTHHFGTPLQIVHPPDNKFPRFEADIEALDISDEEKAKLQAEVADLTGALVVTRDR